jgi:fumarate hydratase subunit beta
VSDEPLRITTPLFPATVEGLRAGDRVLLSGVIYTARDAAHARMAALLDAGRPLPFDPRGAVIYYVGPAPASPGRVIGPAGPTTSGRMDLWTPRLLALGVKGMIGKGGRSAAVRESMAENRAVYFGAVGGAAVLMSRSILEVTTIAWDDLGPEALRRMVVEALPLFVVNDVHGGDLYEEGRARWKA